MNFKDFFANRGIKIKNEELMREAFTHSSYQHENNLPYNTNYERLEFLGDAVLEAITSEYFYLNTDLKEGEMSKIRASFVCENALATYAKEIGLNKYILAGHGQESNINDTIIADVFESVLGVIYLENGYEVAKKYAEEIIIPYIEKGYKFFKDYKTAFQELVQTDKKSVTYELVSETGPAHDRTFKMNAIVDGMIFGTGVGKSKKDAEQAAAKNAYEKQAKL